MGDVRRQQIALPATMSVDGYEKPRKFAAGGLTASHECAFSVERALQGVKGVRSTAERTLDAFQRVEKHGPWPVPEALSGHGHADCKH